MSVIDTLIYDRTAADVERVYELALLWVLGDDGKPIFVGTAAQKAEWDAGLKGAYNDTDLNRVGTALEYLSARLAAAAYPVTVTPKTDWVGGEHPDIPSIQQIEAYLQQVSAIRAALPLLPSTPAVPETAGLNWQGANDIEQILADVDRLLTNAAAAFRHCGASVCGGGGLLIL